MYRNRIGKFDLSGRNSQYKISRKYDERKRSGRFSYLIKLVLMILMISSPSTLNETEKSKPLSWKLSPHFTSCQNTPTHSGLAQPALVNPSSACTLNWSHSNKPNNKLGHALFGNRRLGYKIGFWNCRKKLISNTEFDTNKLTDIKAFFSKHNPHIFGIIESNIYGINSSLAQFKKFSTDEVQDKLHIEGYHIILPATWSSHGQARILAYVRDDVRAKIVSEDIANSDLPSISLEVGLGREKKTIVNLFYREWKGGITKLNTQASQIERLQRQMHHWKSLANTNKDVVIMGDANLCALAWDDPDYDKKNLSEIIQDFLLEESFFQLVKGYTRSEVVRGGNVSTSCLDHVYSNTPHKCDTPVPMAAGDSDHLAIIFTKYSKDLKTKPQTIKKRNYKNFMIGNFLTDVYNSGINEEIRSLDNLDEAATKFQEKFGSILDHHAPVKVFQIRKHYVPYISEETKLLMEERDALKEEATEHVDKVLLDEFKAKRNKIKENAKEDQVVYNEKEFDDTKSSSNVWKSAYKFLGQTSNKAPTQLSDQFSKAHG